MNEYRGKHSASRPWPVANTASSHYRSRHLQRNKKRKRWVIALVIFLVAALLYPFAEAALLLQVDRISLVSEDLPADIGRLRIVYLTDIHDGFFYPDGRMRSLVSTVQNLKPDIVIFGGDIGDNPDAAISFYQRLPSLHARYAVLGVLGEADHGETDLERSMVTDAMRNAGVVPLVNETVPVRIGTSVIYVAGLDDVLSGKPSISALSSRVSASDFVVFVSHNPSVIPDSQRAVDSSGRLGWFDLALFGHTHGGQVAGLSGLLNIAGDVEDRYQRGLLQENRSTLLISNGVGTSVLPIRFLRRPQVHCIDISLP